MVLDKIFLDRHEGELAVAYARLFHADEAAELIAEFDRELARLKAASPVT